MVESYRSRDENTLFWCTYEHSANAIVCVRQIISTVADKLIEIWDLLLSVTNTRGKLIQAWDTKLCQVQTLHISPADKELLCS